MDLSNEFHPVPKPIKRVKMPKKLKQMGKKGKEWADVRAELKKRFYKAGITKCEIKFDGCLRDDFLGFAHLAKRRKLTHEDLYKVVLACDYCHDIVEKYPAEKMKKFLLNIITNRKVKI
jgi:hypothetical protein